MLAFACAAAAAITSGVALAGAVAVSDAPVRVGRLGLGASRAILAVALALGVGGLVALAIDVSHRDAAARASTLRLILYTAAAATAYDLAFLQPYERDATLGYVGAACGALAFLLLVAPWTYHALATPLGQRLDVLFLNLVLTAVAGEAALRCAARVVPSQIMARASSASVERVAQARRSPESQLYDFTMESHGYDDEEFVPRPGQVLVTCIGDSFSSGAIARPFHYTTIAERELPGVSVFNIGVPGIGPPEYLYLLERDALPLHPDLVVVAIFVGNDIAENERYVGSQGWLASVFDRENLLLYLLPTRMARLAGEDAQAMNPGTHPGSRNAAAGAPTTEDLLQRYPELGDPLLERPYFSEDTFFEIEWNRAYQVFRKGETGLYSELFPVLSRLREVSAPTQLLILLIPTEMQVDDALWERVSTYHKGLVLDRDQPQRVLGTWLQEQGIPFLDPLPQLRAVPPLADGSRHLYHLRNTHLNRHGFEVLGLAFAEFLRPHVERVRAASQ